MKHQGTLLRPRTVSVPNLECFRVELRRSMCSRDSQSWDAVVLSSKCSLWCYSTQSNMSRQEHGRSKGRGGRILMFLTTFPWWKWLKLSVDVATHHPLVLHAKDGTLWTRRSSWTSRRSSSDRAHRWIEHAHSVVCCSSFVRDHALVHEWGVLGL